MIVTDEETVRQIKRALQERRRKVFRGNITEWWEIVRPEIEARTSRQMYLDSHKRVNEDGGRQ